MSKPRLRKRVVPARSSAILQSAAIELIHFPSTGLTSDSGMLRPARRGRIVVGVTHGRAARRALRWAYQTAVVNDTLLVVVTAYESPHPFLTIHGWVYVDARFRRGGRVRAGQGAT